MNLIHRTKIESEDARGPATAQGAAAERTVGVLQARIKAGERREDAYERTDGAERCRPRSRCRGH